MDDYLAHGTSFCSNGAVLYVLLVKVSAARKENMPRVPSTILLVQLGDAGQYLCTTEAVAGVRRVDLHLKVLAETQKMNCNGTRHS